MKKDFYHWHLKKVAIHESDRRPLFSEREIWFRHLGLNVGFEQDGKGDNFLRPVLILRKFNPYIFWCVPLTRSLKNNPFYFIFSFKNGSSSAAVLSQIRLVDSQRLSHRIGSISELDYLRLKEKLKGLLP